MSMVNIDIGGIISDSMERSISINDNSILSELKKYINKPEMVIAEYVWNAFDAGANKVDICYSYNSSSDGISFGYPNLSISDDGNGWDMSQANSTVATFLDSEKRLKKVPYRSLPHGSRGIGRFSFQAIANSAEWTSNCNGKKYTLVLKSESISKFTINEEEQKNNKPKNGSTVKFNVTSNLLNEAFFETLLPKDLLKRFAWFLTLYPEKNIYINSKAIDPRDLIEAEKDADIEINNQKFTAHLIQWKNALADKEFSKIYFQDEAGNEIFKLPSGLNNKSDIFYHAAYIKSNEFIGYIPSAEEESGQQGLLDTDQKKLIGAIKKEIRKALEDFREPYIEKISETLVDKLKEEKVMPSPESLHVPEECFSELVRQTYVIAPEMYSGMSTDNKKMILGLLASLMGTNESNIILKMIDEVYKLSNTQRAKLEDLLKRTSLGNIVDTIQEIDYRLQTLDDLESLVYDPDKYKDTLEVKHLQKILDKDFWVFGEEYRLVSSTEGAIKNTINRFASEILGIADYNTESESRKEVDLFLSKKIVHRNSNGMYEVHNIVVELKRPSVKLSKEELDQIKEYKRKILEDPACSTENIHWTFILVGKEFSSDDAISDAIENMRNNGEASRGLVECLPKKNCKVYVRKWSDIINCELRPQYEYLKEKLKLEQRNPSEDTQEEIVSRHQ